MTLSPQDRAAEAAAELRRQAEEFFALPELRHTGADRLREVRESIASSGTYTHTPEELLLGARLAWRNHARCVGRMHWRSLRLLDFRGCRTAEQVAEACWEHLRFSTNGGRLRAAISVFAQAVGESGISILNPQLIRYAGYRGEDGTVLGDPLHTELTELAVSLGWKGAGTAFDVLPLIVRMPGEAPRMFDIPEGVVMEVPLVHPRFGWFAELGLKWHANPAISDLDLEIGGIRYPAAPFSGWYVGSEIGARNLSDVDRYDLLPTVARRMGLDLSHDRSLWKDRALVELTAAVQHSYRLAGVHIVDHHTAARQFVDHVEREEAAGRTVPTQWSWVNPPMSSSTTPTFHREYDAPDFGLRPNFVARADRSRCPLSALGPEPGRPPRLAPE
ncbi:nitric oxide synthase oxygenase [Streptomyces sp. WMMC1477]|uniref:nitric oxide synthase oxygenase n=1 Tax=Streptomyces sp. WMMC1477 TaxID=3015155 RepID=UPI0022B6DA3B|nr:nitric oxide synthase oxygenase [Streptomyces sp. WMMC1477]MCZ7434653.1 nitric oxide synthase oxygenase [Streptomyces sp. WMMC1477]